MNKFLEAMQEENGRRVKSLLVGVAIGALLVIVLVTPTLLKAKYPQQPTPQDIAATQRKEALRIDQATVRDAVLAVARKQPGTTIVIDSDRAIMWWTGDTDLTKARQHLCGPYWTAQAVKK